jgi:hypothetical protein
MKKALAEKEDELNRFRTAQEAETNAAEHRFQQVSQELERQRQQYQAEMEAARFALQEQERAAAAAAAAAEAAATAAAAAAVEQARNDSGRVVALSPRRGALRAVQEAPAVREEWLDSASPVYDARRDSRPPAFSPSLRSPACADPAIDALLQSAVAQRTRGRTGANVDSARGSAPLEGHAPQSAVKLRAPVRRICHPSPYSIACWLRKCSPCGVAESGRRSRTRPPEAPLR